MPLANKTENISRLKRILISCVFWMLFTTLVIIIPNVSPFIATPFVLIGLIVVMGVMLAINLKIQTDKFSEYILYSVGLGLAFTIIGGLAINWALPYFGLIHPLARLTLIIFFDTSALILAFRAYLFNKSYTLPNIPLPKNKISLVLGIFPWLFIIFSICGAEILNNGGRGTLTLAMLALIAIYFLVLIICHKRIDGWAYVSALYSISISMLLMYSLRSSHIFGWDINQEYQVFQMTLQNLRWKMSYYPGLDYNACMSITILPTIFKELTNAPSEYIYKVTFQLLFAITPVAVYAIARRYLKEVFSFLAAFLLISQTWFFEQMPGLIRQETAFIFYAIILLVLFDNRITKRSRYILFYIFTLALIISHYSSSYVWIALMLISLILFYAARLLFSSLRIQNAPIKPAMFIVSLLILFVWQVPITHTSGTATTTAGKINVGPPIASISSSTTFNNSSTIILSSDTSVNSGNATTSPTGITGMIQSALATIFFSNGNPNTDQNVFLAEINATYLASQDSIYEFYPTSTTASYTPKALTENLKINSKLPQTISLIIIFLAWASKILFIDIFPLIAIFVMYIALRKRQADKPYDFIILNIGAFILIGSMIIFPNLQQYYGLTRLYLQIFFALSTVAVMGGLIVTNYFPRYQSAILAVLTIFLFLSLNSYLDQFAGGQARITLNQPPGNDDSYYIYDTEIASARWLSINHVPNAPIQADDVAYLRLQSFGDITSGSSAIFPSTIEPNSYVYLDKINTTEDIGFNLFKGNLLTYNEPLDFLNSAKNLIYNNGESRIYK
jgi:uncharacterized membrane protein